MTRSLKHIISITLFLVILVGGVKSSNAQVNCDISINSSLPVCPGGIYTLSVEEGTNYVYSWKADGNLIGENQNTLTVPIDKETLFGITVMDQDNNENCFAELLVTVRPEFTIEFNQWQLTCSNGDEDIGNNAKVQAFGIGEQNPEEYTYEWNVNPIQIAPGTPSLAIGLKAHQFYNIKVSDIHGCSQDGKFWTESYDNPDIEIFTDPDTAYIQNPYVTFTYVNLSVDSIGISNHFWDFGDESETSDLDDPVHMYQEEGSYIASLTVYNDYGCDTFYTTEVLIKPVKLFIPNVFTPNGDGINDTFIITEDNSTEEEDLKSSSQFEYESYDPLELYYTRSELHIFNRWGRIVYQSNNYQNDWDGSNLPDGVYFYVLKCYGAQSDDIFKGSVSIYGSGR